MNTLAIVQARVSSTRLPGKVLKPILGKPLIQLQIERISRANKLDRLIVATSCDSSDDTLCDLCISIGIEYYRGDLNDVLDRFYKAAVQYGPDTVVRLTADCPLIDPEVIDRIIAFFSEGDFDYASNTIERTYPDGLDVEVFRFLCLEDAWREAMLPSEREHVTPFIHKQPNRYRLGSYKSVTDISHYRWTVDEPEDYELIKAIYEKLYPKNHNFTYSDVLNLFNAQPELKQINDRFETNEGYAKSMQRG